MVIRAYVRVSTADQAANGHGLDAQRATITSEADRRGWTALHWYSDGGQSGKDMDRPAMQRLLRDVHRGDALVVARLDRLSRSLTDFATLMERAQREHWNVVALDLGIDLSTPNGEFMASVLAAMARWERRIIGQRTREGLAAAKAKGRLPGRRSALPRPVQDHLLTCRADGVSLRDIAAQLTTDQVLTASGRTVWAASTVRSALRSAMLERESQSRLAESLGRAPTRLREDHQGGHPDNPSGVVAPDRERQHRARIPEANPPVDLSVHLLRTRDRGVPQVPEVAVAHCLDQALVVLGRQRLQSHQLPDQDDLCRETHGRHLTQAPGGPEKHNRPAGRQHPAGLPPPRLLASGP